jgi:RimJ/RimL family protein N-acetyltransferase
MRQELETARLRVPWQGHGLATEAGRACVEYAFGELGFERVVSVCTRRTPLRDV